MFAPFKSKSLKLATKSLTFSLVATPIFVDISFNKVLTLSNSVLLLMTLSNSAFLLCCHLTTVPLLIIVRHLTRSTEQCYGGGGGIRMFRLTCRIETKRTLITTFVCIISQRCGNILPSTDLVIRILIKWRITFIWVFALIRMDLLLKIKRCCMTKLQRYVFTNTKRQEAKSTNRCYA